MILELTGHVERDARPWIESLLDDEPAILVEGPRGSGKSTLLGEVTSSRGGRALDLDDPATARLVAEDPAGAITGPSLTFIDEYQRVPEVLSAVKRAVDRGNVPGRFLLAGSVSGRLLPTGSETLTGRVHRHVLPPLSTGELLGTAYRLLPHLLADGEPPRVDSGVRRADYFELVAAGGYPAALRRGSHPARRRWFSSYLSTVADRDLPGLVDIRHPGALLRLYRAVAEHTSTPLNTSTLAERLGLHPATARAYLDLLAHVHLVGELPGWTAGVSAKAARRPKAYVTDTGLGAGALQLDGRRLAASAAGGPMLETFVVNEIAKQVAVLDEPVLLGHFRDRSGIEVDLVIERVDGSVVGIEVKSAASAGRGDATGLSFLRERLGRRFICGLVLHTGPLTARLGERLWAVPVAGLWGGHAWGDAADA
jgi:predicted AAA+ superfamily ATPase